MGTQNMSSAPEFREWSIVAVKLLQGVIYSDESKVWEILLGSRSVVENHFARLGLAVVVDESEGYAFLRQWNESECPAGYEQLPKVIKRVPLGYAPTLLAVIFRDELRRFEDEDLNNERCVVEIDSVFEEWKQFFPPGDEVRQRQKFQGALAKLEELCFVRKVAESPETWEVRKILKARLPAAELEALKTQLLKSAAEQGLGESNHE